MSERPPPLPDGPPPGYGPPPAYPPAPPYAAAPYGAAPPYGDAPYGAAPYGTGGYGTPPRAPGTDGVAIAAFVLAILSIVPVAVALGILALRRIRRTGRGGRGLAIAALAISAAWVVLIGALVAVGLATGTKRDDTGAITKPGSLQATDLKKGDCLRSAPASDTSVTSVDVTPCTAAHSAEVFATFDLPDGAYPGETQVSSTAEKGCSDRLPTLPAGGDDLDLYYLTPQQAGWKLGDRSVTCFVVSKTPVTKRLVAAR